ncbi:MAG: TonB-dependent receptor [Rubrivivax sp.]
MKKNRAPHALHALAAAALVALQPGAQAQNAEAGKLSVVTITAERRVENAQEVPNSVSVLSPELLDVVNTGGQDIRGISGRVPSLNIESSFGRAFPRFYIRGYGNTDFRLNASQPVSLVYDDVVQENPILKGFPAFDLDRIEVLRGPQGTLFGRNTPAGVVKFDSARPTRKLEGYGSLSFGTFQTINAEGAVNMPIGESFSTRLSVLNQSRDDWVHNTYDAGPTRGLEGYRDSALRGQVLFEPNADLSVLGSVHARDFRGSARLFRANIIKPGTNDLVDGFDEKSISIDGKNHSELQNYGANLRVRIGLGPVALHSITGFETVHTYSRGDIDGGYGSSFAVPPIPSGPGFIPFPSETADGLPKHAQWTQEFRLESAGSGPFSWQAGVYFFHEDYKIESFGYDSLTAGNPQSSYERSHQKNDAYALFGNVNFAVTPELKLRAGLRYTHDKKTFAVEEYQNGAATLTDLQAGGPTSAAPSDSKVNWDLSGTYAVAKDVSLYARVATGYRGSSVQGAGAFNGQSVAGPENNTSVEFGIKSDLLDRRARVNFGVFSYQVKDLQLTAVGGAANANILLNAKKASGQGFELDGQALLGDNFLASLGVGYNKTKIKDPNLSVATCAACTVTDPTYQLPGPFGPVTYAYIDGNPLPQAPKVTISTSLKYTQPVGPGDFYALTDWVYRSKVNFFLYESVEFTGKSLLEGGLRLGYTWGNGKYDAAAFVRNITNQIRVVGGIDFNNLTGFINEPRTFGVQFKAAF